MASLLPSHQYSLCTENNSNKSVIYVKLTDSAIQTIETFLNSKDDLMCKPTIQVKDNNGIISIPLNGRPHNYVFTLSNIETVDGQQSSFQCLQHVNDSSLESLGFMYMKMLIHATDDSYAKTKSKMTAADQEQKKMCTKELRQSVTRVGKRNKVSVKRPGLVYIPEKTPSNVLKSEPVKLMSNIKETSPTLIQQPIRKRIIHILAAKPYKKAELLLRLKREGINDKDKDQINVILAQVAKIKGHILTLEDRVWCEVQEDWEFSSKEELQLIIKKKKQFLKPDTSGLTSLSKSCNTKKDMCKKKEQNNNLFHNVAGQNCKSPEEPNLLSNGTLKVSETQPAIINKVSALQLSFVPQENGKGKTNVKRKEQTCMDISSNGVAIGQHSNLITSNTASIYKQREQPVSKIQVKQSNNCSQANASSSGYSARLALLEKVRSVKQRFKEESSLPSVKNVVMKGNENNGSNSEELATNISVPDTEFDLSEIRKKYTRVESLEQRSQYVEDYNNEYEEYVKLRIEMKETSEQFSALKRLIKAYAEGSCEYKKLNKQIKKEYERKVKEGYYNSRKRYCFLREKFSFIQKLVEEFDENL